MNPKAFRVREENKKNPDCKNLFTQNIILLPVLLINTTILQ